MKFIWVNNEELNEIEVREHLEISERAFMDEVNRVRDFRSRLKSGMLRKGDEFLTCMAVEEHGWDRTGPSTVVVEEE